ncbi:DNA cytosine methyltransferase [Serinicoccus sp. CUA-874]|uniref:DNA cytosine methyltransferase n=1 Tax=Serinicoccus sp. CUA-874 TaxID=1517939 RepID=UPI0013017385|nr:DNA cytosine methyltransferase [Serinicoccus sp. CUA-874]
MDVVAAGFPCTDLSQVGRMAGIDGGQSGLIKEVFRLIDDAPPTWLVLENVPNMLSLHSGSPIAAVVAWLEADGWNWAYRTVDSQHFGVRQRRRRVFLVASQSEDPRTVLFADETSPPYAVAHRHAAYGFYWTEGNRGLGWGPGVTPTLKGGSAVGIASPPAIWRRDRDAGQAISRPSIEVGERLQGFRAGWTSQVDREGIRWKLVGNAVTVPVATWLGSRLAEPRPPADVPSRPLPVGSRWPSAAASILGAREAWSLSERPLARRQRSTLDGLLDEHGWAPLSLGATLGFTTRFKASRLKQPPGFVEALDAHIDAMA